MKILTSLLKASMVAAAVFAIAWIRLSHFASSLGLAARLFVGYGILITIVSLVIGSPLTLVLKKFELIRRWVCAALGAITGALLGGTFTYRPDADAPVEVQNPFALTFSPWNNDAPGFASPTHYHTDFAGSVVLGACVGAALGFAFWYFYSRGQKRSTEISAV